MNETESLLKVRDLSVQYISDEATVQALSNVSFDIKKGVTLGLVGETGAGKTTIAKSIMRLIQTPPGKFESGEIFYDGTDLLKLSQVEMQRVRGAQVSMIFQDPMTALDPVMTVGKQIAEVISTHEKCSNAEAMNRAKQMLETVGIQPKRADEYPHQFSGGMKQRVVIAIALACNPNLLIADEPTTALDVTIQAQVLDLMRNLREKMGTSLLLITHDLGVVAQICENVAIVYAGEIVEYGTCRQIFHSIAHPYTEGLFGSVPNLSKEEDRLSPIEGLMPDPSNLPSGCKFHPRCKYAKEICSRVNPPLTDIGEGHMTRCCLGTPISTPENGGAAC